MKTIVSSIISTIALAILAAITIVPSFVWRYESGDYSVLGGGGCSLGRSGIDGPAYNASAQGTDVSKRRARFHLVDTHVHGDVTKHFVCERACNGMKFVEVKKRRHLQSACCRHDAFIYSSTSCPAASSGLTTRTRTLGQWHLGRMPHGLMCWVRPLTSSLADFLGRGCPATFVRQASLIFGQAGAKAPRRLRSALRRMSSVSSAASASAPTA